MRSILIMLAAGALAACGSDPAPDPAPPAEREKSGLEIRMEAPGRAQQDVDAAQRAAQARIDSQMAEVAGDSVAP